MSEWRKICCKHCGRPVNFTAMEIKAIQNTRNEWIPVSERPPEDGDYSVLAHFSNGSIETIHVTQLLNFNGVAFELRITHWMPRPAPPKGE